MAQERRPGARLARRWATVVLAGLWVGHGAWVLRGRGPAGLVSRGSRAVAQPFLALSARWEVFRAARAQRVRDLQQARAEIEGLRGEVDRLRTEALRNAPRLAEAEDMARLSGLRQQLPLDLRPARVLANLRRAPYGGFVLDQGQDTGLAADQGVICPEGVVGRIWEAGPHQASVLPLDAYNASTGVMLARSRATGVLQGTGPGTAEIRYIGIQEGVQPGEAVYTSGMDGVFPRGLLVGSVTRVSPRDLELEIEVALAAPMDRLHLVLVLPPRPPRELQPPAQAPGLPSSKPGVR